MVLREVASLDETAEPLGLIDLPEPALEDGEILIRVKCCGVCHTELDEIEGRTTPPRLPVVLGHQVVGTVEKISLPSESIRTGDRVGVAWIYSACGICQYCRAGQENLCEQFKATGRDANGGYAEYMKIKAQFAYHLPESLSDAECAPLLCAGAVGYRALRLTNLQDGQALGLSGFGASGHLVLKMVHYKYPHTEVSVFSRNAEEREFARSLGAVWAGDFHESPPHQLHAVIDTTPVWNPISQALKHLEPGGRMVINAIRKEELDKQVLLRLDYPSQLWMEKEIKSVANVTRQDVREFLQLAAEARIQAEYQEYALKDANRALREMKKGKIRGAKVLSVA